MADGPYGPAFSATISGRRVEPLCRSCVARMPPASCTAAHRRLRDTISASPPIPVTLVAPPALAADEGAARDDQAGAASSQLRREVDEHLGGRAEAA